MYKLERHKACHSPPAVIDFGNDATELHEDCEQNTISRKRAGKAQLQVIQNYADNQKERFERTIGIMKESIKTKKRLADAIIAFLLQ